MKSCSLIEIDLVSVEHVDLILRVFIYLFIYILFIYLYIRLLRNVGVSLRVSVQCEEGNELSGAKRTERGT